MVSSSSRPPSLPGFCAPWCNWHTRHCTVMHPTPQLTIASYLRKVFSLVSSEGYMCSLIFIFHYYQQGWVDVQSVCFFSQWSRKENLISCFEWIAQISILSGVGIHIVHQVYCLFPGVMTFGALCMLKTRGRMSGIIDSWVHRPWFTVGFCPMIWLLSDNMWLPMVYKLISSAPLETQHLLNQSTKLDNFYITTFKVFINLLISLCYL